MNKKSWDLYAPIDKRAVKANQKIYDFLNECAAWSICKESKEGFDHGKKRFRKSEKNHESHVSRHRNLQAAEHRMD